VFRPAIDEWNKTTPLVPPFVWGYPGPRVYLPCSAL